MSADGYKGLIILGSTGSIGTQTLEVVARYPDRFRVVGLAAASNADLLAEQAARFGAEAVCLLDSAGAEQLRGLIGERNRAQEDAPTKGAPTTVLSGESGMSEIAAWPGAEMVVVAIAGNAALSPSVAAIEARRDLALATKEILVAGGSVVTEAARRKGVRLLPVDSEHSAIFQCLEGEDRAKVRKLILTASGGPFLDTPIEYLAAMTVEQTLEHPTWRMGAKITIDSATMMNKGLEVIEARWLFGVTPDRIAVVIHPQSIIHSMVEFTDGSIMAQLGLPDMRLPIQYALWYPERAPEVFQTTSMPSIGTLTFSEPDLTRFPCLGLAYEALRIGGTAPCVMNAANEVAVAAYLAGRIGFVQIHEVIERVMRNERVVSGSDLEGVLCADRSARAAAEAVIAGLA